MTYSPENLRKSSITTDFAGVAGSQRAAKRRPAPFSLRLSSEERRRLTEEAADIPLGSYIKGKLLDQGVASIRRRRSGLAIEDRQALARALALLGQSRLASNLNQLAHAAHIGALPVTPEIEAELAEGVAAVREVRALLVQALGLKADAAP